MVVRLGFVVHASDINQGCTLGLMRAKEINHGCRI